MADITLVATRDFNRGELHVRKGDEFTVAKDVADFLTKVSEVAEKAPKDEKPA